jgi:hypothetical protein
MVYSTFATFHQTPENHPRAHGFYAVKLLNYFPVKGGILETYGPKAIMSGEALDFKKCSLPFGSYCQVHEEQLPWNSLIGRTLGAISLGPGGNTQGGHRFFALNTGHVISRRGWDVIPMPTSVFTHYVHRLFWQRHWR